MELVGIGNATLALDIGDAAVDLGIHVDVHLLALLDEEQLVNLVAQGIGSGLGHGVLQCLALQALFFSGCADAGTLAVQFAPGDNLTVDLGSDFLHNFDLRHRAVGRCGIQRGAMVGHGEG